MRRITFAAVSALLLGACGGQESLVTAKPSLALGLEAADFGAVPAGATKVLEVPVSNTGESVLDLCVADDDGMRGPHDNRRRCAGLTRIVPDDGVFSLKFEGVDPKTGIWPVTVGQNGKASRTFKLSFTPPAMASFEATLYVVDDYMTRMTSLVIRGSGVQPTIKVMPDRIDFGRLLPRESAKTTITLENAGSLDQPFVIDQLVGDRFGFFSVLPAGTMGAGGRPIHGTVPAMGQISADVWYSPLWDHEDTISLVVSYCPGCTLTVPIHGISAVPDSSAAGASDKTRPDHGHNPGQTNNPSSDHRSN